MIGKKILTVFGVESSTPKNEHKFESLANEMDQIKGKINHINTKLDILLDAVRTIQVNSILKPETTTTNKIEMNLEITPISSVQELIDMEKKLKQYNAYPSSDKEFAKHREALIQFYSKKVTNNKPGSSDKNGMMNCLKELYFDKQFVDKVGWTEVRDCFPMRSCDGHVALFFEIINRGYPKTYNNLKQARNALRSIIRRDQFKLKK